MILRDYQTQAIEGAYKLWSLHRNIALVLPTGAGKTVIMAHIARQEKGPRVAIAHRQELVSQISLAFAEQGIRHKILAPHNVTRAIIGLHLMVHGKDFIDPLSDIAVAGVDTLVSPSRQAALSPWAKTVKMWLTDECHHLLRKNKWGKAVEMFPNAKGLGVTATFMRPDGKGLGVEYDGVFESFYTGPTPQDLIGRGYLSDFQIFSHPTNIDFGAIPIGSTGDYVHKKLVMETRRSSIVGDMPKHYLDHARGKRGISFVTDVQTGQELADKYNSLGVPSAFICAKTPDKERIAATRKLGTGEILQLVNVDILGEGFDCPAVEVASYGRATASYVVYSQQFGRVLRIMKGKPHATILDHVGNVLRFKGPPDIKNDWSLARRNKREEAAEPSRYRACTMCPQMYLKYLESCPHCGHTPVNTPRGLPQQVEGDLQMLTPEAIKALRKKCDAANMPSRDYELELINKGCPDVGLRKNVRHYEKVLKARENLTETMMAWGAHYRDKGLSLSQRQRLFYQRFGYDVMTARTLNLKITEDLNNKLLGDNLTL